LEGVGWYELKIPNPASVSIKCLRWNLH